MTPKQFQKFLSRDCGRCYHCGTTEGLVPQHRQGGMGGNRDQRPCNIITFCGTFNNEIEVNARAAAYARVNGWKLRPGENPAEVPVFDRYSLTWFDLAAGDYTRKVVQGQ